jgi:hypothetical protein
MDQDGGEPCPSSSGRGSWKAAQQELRPPDNDGQPSEPSSRERGSLWAFPELT